MTKRLEKLVREFFSILDKIEESDGGNEFRPTHITSCRAMDIVKLDRIVGELRFGLNIPPPRELREPEITNFCEHCNGDGQHYIEIDNKRTVGAMCSDCNGTGIACKECPDCNGNGYITHDFGSMMENRVDCQRCYKTGKV